MTHKWKNQMGDGWRIPIEYCGDKVCYDLRGAQTARNSRKKEAHVDLRIYLCPQCGKFHLTHLIKFRKYKKGWE